ncbi:MAG TPA: oxygen-independent coproporphyrinogen III oxidase, partial [Planctomycetota bacterium]|nr:oxygen-independent coproporphyrinogen III oxidase [Planctomycetota bacterium]
FKADFGPADFGAALGELGKTDPEARPLSLYVHLPFCSTLCLFCGCNTVITKKEGVAGKYLDALEVEVATVAKALGSRRVVRQLHLGGGTPTYLTVEELERLHAILAKHFDLRDDEKAIEIDPRVTSVEQMKTLARLGFNRCSFGVQDFADDVQRAVNRVQSVEETRFLFDIARGLGFKGINVDLIYGLPFQKLDTFEKSIEAVLDMRPDRIALYSYAHVPWMRPGQGGFERHEMPLPSAELKMQLFTRAIDRFGAAGYRHLGMDHFALPDDELALALDRGTLHRNFQGYTVRRAPDLLGLGQSSISDIGGSAEAAPGVYAQAEKDNAKYEAAAAGGRLSTVRGLKLTAEDERRRKAILAIMCEGRLEGELARGFEQEIASLAPLAERGLVNGVSKGRVEVTPLGRLFLRNIAMAFDVYLPKNAERPMFSRTV